MAEVHAHRFSNALVNKDGIGGEPAIPSLK
jgi:hypothetical protein